MSRADHKRHGGAYDRGSADFYYWRPRCPHYFKGNSYGSERVERKDMTEEEIAAYNAGYDDPANDRKNWG